MTLRSHLGIIFCGLRYGNWDCLVVKSSRWWTNKIEENNFSVCIYAVVESRKHMFNLWEMKWYVLRREGGREERVVLGCFAHCFSLSICLGVNRRRRSWVWHLSLSSHGGGYLTDCSSHRLCLWDLSMKTFPFRGKEHSSYGSSTSRTHCSPPAETKGLPHSSNQCLLVAEGTRASAFCPMLDTSPGQSLPWSSLFN